MGDDVRDTVPKRKQRIVAEHGERAILAAENMDLDLRRRHAIQVDALPIYRDQLDAHGQLHCLIGSDDEAGALR